MANRMVIRRHQIITTAALAISMVLDFFYPHYLVRAATLVDPASLDQRASETRIEMDLNRRYNGYSFPEIYDRAPLSVVSVLATAYSSTPDQTDGDPFTTAWGTTVRDGIIASNFLALGTYVKFPDLYGDKFFRVEDRMNPRYSFVVDIWMSSRQEAKQFGVKVVRMEIY